MAETLLEIEGLSKTFPGLRALSDVSLSVRRGEIVAVIGQNGSGKSTLIKILAGIYEPDPGASIRIPDRAGSALGGVEARSRLHFIHQDLGLVGMLNAVENLDLGRPLLRRGWLPVRRRREARRARQLLAAFGVEVDVNLPVSELTAAERTIIAIARALEEWDSPDGILVLDEPTAALHGAEVEKLFTAVRRVAEQGAGVIFVSHRLDEVMSLADRIAVLRDGHLVADASRGNFEHRSLVHAMAGREVEEFSRPVTGTLGSAALTARGLTAGQIEALSFDLHAGEVLGVTGTLGSGREHLAAILFGSVPREAGDVRVGEQLLPPNSTRAAISSGIALVPSERARYGGVMSMTVRENLTLPRLSPLRTAAGRIGTRAERAEAAHWIAEVDVQPPDPERELKVLSGGNQQKVVLAKWLRTNPSVLLLDEPTQGVDVAAKAVIFNLITEAAAAGAAVLICSSDTAELVTLCNRVLVLRDGRLSRTFERAELTEENLVSESIGISELSPDEPGAFMSDGGR